MVPSEAPVIVMGASTLFPLIEPEPRIILRQGRPGT